MTETLLTIAVALFGGLNIFQFIFLGATKQKNDAEVIVFTTLVFAII